MKRWYQYIRYSFSARLSLWVTGIVTAIFVITLYLMSRFALTVVKDESLESMKLSLENTVMRARTDSIEQVVAQMSHIFPHGQCILQKQNEKRKFDESGYRPIIHEGEDAYEFYVPFKNTEQVIIYICPEATMLTDYKHLLKLAFLTVAIGLLLLLWACRMLIDKHLRPLDQLERNVRHISKNNFEEAIQHVERKDEIGGLQNSFSTMQHTLADIIHEIHQKTETLRQRQQELETAYERAQEDQRVKSSFLRNITYQLIQPVSTIHALTTTISVNYLNLPHNEMSRIRTEIISQTNEITNLIDKKLITSKQVQSPSESNEKLTAL